ncbi:unnamed protein product, partial [Owenia fusiformis]
QICKMRESMEKLIDYFKKYPSLPLFCGFGVAYISYYLFHVAKKPLVACGDSKLKAFLMTHCPILHEKFWPTLWCFESRGQTILRSLMKSNPVINYASEILETPDGGMIKLDWMENDNSETYCDKNTRPTVIVLPGLTGSSQESYALHMADEARKKGYRVVVFNNRGMGGTKLLTARTYCAANTEDMATVVDHVNEKYPKAPLVGVGVSLGGMILVNYIGKQGKDCKLHGAMTFSTAFCPFASRVSLETPVNRYIFNHHLTSNLLQYVSQYTPLFNNHVDMKKVAKCKTIYEFDDHFTAKIFGYENAEEYYHDANLHYKVDKIEIPLLCLNAADDPFSPLHAIPIKEAEKNENVALVVTSHGGHIGFLEGLFPRHTSYMDRMYGQFIDAIFKHGGELQRSKE